MTPSTEQKKRFTVYAYKPMWCEVEADDAETAKKLAVEQGEWVDCDDSELPTDEDIHEVVADD